MVSRADPFLEKALESLAGAEAEFRVARYNNCANRAYYACFQAAIAALIQAGIHPRGGQWGHEFVPAQFDGVLINRRHLYPRERRGVLERARSLRLRADYDQDQVAGAETDRVLRRTRLFVAAVAAEVQR